MYLECGRRDHRLGELQKIWAVLDLPPVPGLRNSLAFSLACILFGLVPLEHLGFVAFDTAREEISRGHLLLVTTHDHRAAAE